VKDDVSTFHRTRGGPVLGCWHGCDVGAEGELLIDAVVHRCLDEILVEERDPFKVKHGVLLGELEFGGGDIARELGVDGGVWAFRQTCRGCVNGGGIGVKDRAVVEVVGVGVEHRAVVEVDVEAGGTMLRVHLHDSELLAHAA
jgi:hypothetical protein